MDYRISRGDNLWTIVKNNYNCKNNSEIIDLIKQISKQNDIKDPNIIYEGSKITLPETDTFNPTSSTRANGFDLWSGDESNAEKYYNGEEVENFTMFNYNHSTYADDIKDFAQSVINNYDVDNDGSLNYSEFVAMSTNGEGIPEGCEEEYGALFETLFNDLSFDDNPKNINAGEFASLLYAADANPNTGACDGKLDYSNYQTIPLLNPETGYFSQDTSSQYIAWQDIQQSFYDKHYAT